MVQGYVCQPCHIRGVSASLTAAGSVEFPVARTDGFRLASRYMRLAPRLVCVDISAMPGGLNDRRST